MVVEKPDKNRRQVYEYIASTKKKCLFLLRIEVLNPNVKHTPETAFSTSLVALARDLHQLTGEV